MQCFLLWGSAFVINFNMSLSLIPALYLLIKRNCLAKELLLDVMYLHSFVVTNNFDCNLFTFFHHAIFTLCESSCSQHCREDSLAVCCKYTIFTIKNLTNPQAFEKIKLIRIFYRKSFSKRILTIVTLFIIPIVI